MKLTNLQCKTAKPKDKAYKLTDGAGMFLSVQPNGSKYWRIKYHYHGKEKLYAVGVYPKVSLAQARIERARIREIVQSGLDPILERKKAKILQGQSANDTFEAIAREWYAVNKSKWTPKYAKHVIKRLEYDIFPVIGNYPISTIDSTLVLEAIKKIQNRNANEMARRQLQKCSEIFCFAYSRRKVQSDPTTFIKDELLPHQTTHYPAIDTKDIPAFLMAIEKNDARLYKATQNALRLMMLTFVRTSELIQAKWEEIDFERAEWIIPAERMKMRKEHIVPLSKQAIQILYKQKEMAGHWPHVFPSVTKPQKSMSNNTILGAIKRMGYKGRMTGHGFRALAMSTIKQELNYRHEVIDRQLAHAPKSKVTRAYDRAMFLQERKIMMQEWADYIDSQKPNSNIILNRFEKHNEEDKNRLAS